jgi:SMC interacting uncharacterized protein involved in chromosome segregation
MTADYAALEARVADLEQQMRPMLPAKIDAVSYAVSLVHEEMRYLREQSDIHGSALERQEIRLDRHGELLEEILRRLPPGPPAP